MDIRLYTLTGEWENREAGQGQYTTGASLDAPVASRLETLAGKVVKYLCTGIGSDAFDSAYGSRAIPSRPVSKSGMALYRSLLVDDIRRCTDYLRSNEESVPTGVERLEQVRLLDLKYAPGGDSTRVDIYLDIMSDQGRHALVVFSGGGGV